jgi:hypothetical protein
MIDTLFFQQPNLGLSAVSSATAHTAMVLAACHSLVVVEDTPNDEENAKNEGDEEKAGKESDSTAEKLVGDPIELAALQGVKWTWDAKTNCASPGAFDHLEVVLAKLRSQDLNLRFAFDA